MKIISKGAEAILYLSYKDEEVLVKERIKKGYRIPEIDEKIRKQRTQKEEKILSTARRVGINVPKVIDSDKFKLNLEYIKGKRVKEILNNQPFRKEPNPQIEGIGKQIGEIVSKLHEAGIVHGDLTTSNMILKRDSLYLIDFGLGKKTNSIEDKATDLFILHEALKSTHFEVLDKVWKLVLKNYKYTKAKEVLKRLEKIEKRRRYK